MALANCQVVAQAIIEQHDWAASREGVGKALVFDARFDIFLFGSHP